MTILLETFSAKSCTGWFLYLRSEARLNCVNFNEKEYSLVEEQGKIGTVVLGYTSF